MHVIAAVLLLHERSVDEIVTKLRPGELEQVIKLVGRNPGCYPPGTLDALKGRRNVLPPAPPMASVPTQAAPKQPHVRTEIAAERHAGGTREHLRHLARVLRTTLLSAPTAPTHLRGELSLFANVPVWPSPRCSSTRVR
jgi:hypothetical protein